MQDRDGCPAHPTVALRRCLSVGLALLTVPLGAMHAQAGPPRSESGPIRPAAVSGAFYPKDPEELGRQVDGFLKGAAAFDVKGRIVALIAPHAGYAYSGPTAGVAYRQLCGRSYDVVVILAPAHRESLKGANVYPGKGYCTPLGVVPVDVGLADRIVSEGGDLVRSSLAGHRVVQEIPGERPQVRGEHAIEVQLPFLQRTLSDFSIVPIIVGECNLEACGRIADALARALKGLPALLVASSDLYHGESDRACVESDKRTLEWIRARDAKGLSKGLEDGTSQACGGGPILIATMAARQLGANQAEVLAYTNSNAVAWRTGGYVVGYGAVALTDSAGPVSAKPLPDSARSELIRIARDALAHAIRGEPPGPPGSRHPALTEWRPAFVTLTVQGQLRGCIGCVRTTQPLDLTVQQMARSAALEDPRFPPLSPEETERVRIEISVLGPLQPLNDVSKIEIGRHGLMIRQGRASGLLLPQVPLGLGWDHRTFLEQVCLKANLPAGAWKEHDTRLWTFEAEVFGEQRPDQ